MEYNVGTLWGIYIGVLLGSFLLMILLLVPVRKYYSTLSYGTAFFIASILGAIAAFVGASWLDPNTQTADENGWLTALLVIAVVIPVLSIIYIFWMGEYSCFSSCAPKCDPCAKPKVDPCAKPKCDPCEKPKPKCDPCAPKHHDKHQNKHHEKQHHDHILVMKVNENTHTHHEPQLTKEKLVYHQSTGRFDVAERTIVDDGKVTKIVYK